MSKTPPTRPSKKTKSVLLTIGGVNVYYDGNKVWWQGEMTLDADGCPRAYGPEGCEPEPLDYLANAGYDGNWWGIACVDGEPFEQEEGSPEAWPYPGLYVSTTAYLEPGYDKLDCRRYLDSEKVVFSVVPGNVRMSIPPKFLGCRARITDKKNRKSIECVIGDVGPSNHLGEASLAAADYFGIDCNPKCGGSSDRSRWLYECWPDLEAEGYHLQ